jgi:hypothetical protein
MTRVGGKEGRKEARWNRKNDPLVPLTSHLAEAAVSRAQLANDDRFHFRYRATTGGALLAALSRTDTGRPEPPSAHPYVQDLPSYRSALLLSPISS